MLKTGIALAVVAVVVGVTLVGCNRHSPEKRADWVVRKISKTLDLNEAQKTSLDEVKHAFIDMRKRHVKDREAGLTEVKQMIVAEKLDREKVRNLFEKRHQEMQKEFDGVFVKVAAFHDTLNAEQKQKAVEMIEKFESHLRD